MSLNLALGNALSGLKTNQRALSVLSHNIANANTAGYSRQTVNQSAIYVENVGSGVKIDEITRNIDTFLRRSIISQNGIHQANSQVNEYHERLQVLLGEPGAQNSLDETITSFFNNIQLLSETPTNASLRTNATTSSVELARQIADLAFRMEDLRFEADRQISETVSAINSLIRRLDQVNVAMSSAGVLGNSRAGLEDERDSLLKELSKKIDITTFFEEDGKVNVFLSNGLGLVDNVRHEITYTGVPSSATLANDGTLSALSLLTFDNSGKPTGNPQEIISGGQRGNITTILTGGDLFGLQQVRDEIIPEFLMQLDTLAATLRDTMNTVHNQGTAFPPPRSLTGTRLVRPGDEYSWSGNLRVAVLTANGQPVPSGYNDELDIGWRPLELNFADLDSGNGRGKPTIQTIIDEINQQFRAPEPKAKVGVFNNIAMASNVARLPTSPIPQFTFDFDIENISGKDGKLFVTGVTVLDDLATNITSVTQNVPQFTLDTVNTYTTTAGSRDVVVRATTLSNVSAGDRIFLSQPPAGLYNGIPDTELGGYFVVKAVNGNDVTIEVATPALAGPPVGVVGMTLTPAYSDVETGGKSRTRDDGLITVDLTANATSTYYDISVDVGVEDEDGNLSTATITYRVFNNQFNLLNDRFSASAVTGNGERVIPNTTQEALRAILVDENGLELPKFNGVYPPDTPGYLKIIGGNADYRVAIDSLDSMQLGKPDGVPVEAGTNRGFSHFFELNNLFKSNKPTITGDTLQGSAYRLAVEERIAKDPNLVAYAMMERNRQPTDPDAAPDYSYVLYSGNNLNARALAQVGNENASFSAAGGLPGTQITFRAYIGEFLGYVSSRAVEAQSQKATSGALLSGYVERSEAFSNVNLDEELANTIVYQNSYSAAARMISVVDELFNDLLQVVG